MTKKDSGNAENGSSTKPFLRWAGGKNWLANKIEEYLPEKFDNYHEPFLGGGSIFFYLKSKGYIKKSAFLSDLNSDLTDTYNAIKNNPKEVIDRLSEFKNEKGFYYNIRSKVFSNLIDNSAKFLFLNRTSFNGIYRVNRKGEYNVPYGNRKLSKFFDTENLLLASEKLSDAHVSCLDFYDTLTTIKKGDLVFLDPPYTVAHENNGFIKYNQNIFSWEDQIRLNNYILRINEIGAYFIMTNAAHASIVNLYSEVGHYFKLNRPSLIGGKGAKRTIYNELIFSNILHEK